MKILLPNPKDFENSSYRNYMKILLDINDEKAMHLLEVLKRLSDVKTKQLTDARDSAYE